MNALTLNIQTMSSREIAELTGKEHRNVKRDCETMFSELEIDMLSFEHIYLDSMNRQQTEYLLTRELVQTLITGYNIKLRHAVIQRLNELEEQQKPKAVLTQLVIASQPIFEAAFTYAKLFGLEGNQALLSADKATERHTGFSPMRFMQIELKKEEQTLNLTPTEIGKQLNPPLSAVATNKRLESLGYQEKLGSAWVPTTAGKPYAVFLDTGKKHSDGTPVTQLKWLSSILTHLN